MCPAVTPLAIKFSIKTPNMITANKTRYSVCCCLGTRAWLFSLPTPELVMFAGKNAVYIVNQVSCVSLAKVIPTHKPIKKQSLPNCALFYIPHYLFCMNLKLHSATWKNEAAHQFGSLDGGTVLKL